MNPELANEYLKLMEVIAQYDSLSLIIKGWSITVGIAIIGLAIERKSRSLLMLCIFSTIAFSFIDAKYKQFQTNHYPRMEAIEQCSQGKASLEKCIPFQVDRSWKKAHSESSVFKQYIKGNVWLPHVFIFLGAIIILIGHRFYFKQP